MEHETTYLHSTIGTLLTDSLAQYIVTNQINLKQSAVDPITYISSYLRNHVQSQHDTVSVQQLAEQQKTADTVLHTGRQQKLIEEITAAQQVQNDKNSKISALDSVFSVDRTYQTYTDLFNAFIPAIQAATQSTGVTIGRVLVNDHNKQLRYIVADTSSTYMLDNKLDGDTGITWQLYDNTADDTTDDTVDDDGEPLTEEQIKAKQDGKPLNQLFVPNVATYKYSDKIKYFNSKNNAKLSLGAYCAVQITVNELCHNECIDDSIVRETELIDALKVQEEQMAAETREAEEQARLEAEADEDADSDAENIKPDTATEPFIAEPTEEELAIQKQRQTDYIVHEMTRVPVDYIVCFDTLTQNRTYTTEQLQLIQQYVKQLRTAMHTIDLNVFLSERENRRGVLSYLDTYEPLDDDVKAEQIEKLSEKLAKSQPDACTDADVEYTQQKQYMSSKQIISELLSYSSHTLLRGDINVLYALLTLYNYNQSDLVNAFTEAVWDKVRVHLTEELQNKFNQYNPRQINDQYKTITSEINAISKIVDSIDVDTVRDSNVVLYEIYQYIDSVIKLKQTLKQELIDERTRQREAEAKRIAEEEAAEAARLEEEERLAAAEAENEGAEDDEQDDAE